LIGKRFFDDLLSMAKSSRFAGPASGLLDQPRGRLLSYLCGKPQTVAELAVQAGTSGSAVRVHLDGLRDHGLVDFHVERRGVGKPRHVYSLTPAAEILLSPAYAPALLALFETLGKRLNGKLLPLLRETGATLAARAGAASSRKKGAPAAVAALESLGGEVTVKTSNGERVISNGCCPLAAVTRETPQACQMIESMLASVSGLSVHERCERGAHPRCRFALSRPA
jgi:predicted ArsR family transcriptional regulator